MNIASRAFCGCAGLSSVKGAGSCMRIGDNAFAETGFCIFYGDEEGALVRYARANDQPYNIYKVTYMVDDAAAAMRKVKSGEAVPNVTLQPEEGLVQPEGWYTDPELTQAFDFAEQTMPAADLVLYAQTLPLFETEEYIPAQPGDSTAAAGVRITAYHGNSPVITIPEKIGEKQVYTLDASAFPAGSTLHLPSGLVEIDTAAFAARKISLYALPGTAMALLLENAGFAGYVPDFTLSFNCNGGTAVQDITAQAGSPAETYAAEKEIIAVVIP